MFHFPIKVKSCTFFHVIFFCSVLCPYCQCYLIDYVCTFVDYVHFICTVFLDTSKGTYIKCIIIIIIIRCLIRAACFSSHDHVFYQHKHFAVKKCLIIILNKTGGCEPDWELSPGDHPCPVTSHSVLQHGSVWTSSRPH